MVGFIGRDLGTAVLWKIGVIRASHLCHAYWEKVDEGNQNLTFQSLPKHPGPTEVDLAPGFVVPSTSVRCINKHGMITATISSH